MRRPALVLAGTTTLLALALAPAAQADQRQLRRQQARRGFSFTCDTALAVPPDGVAYPAPEGLSFIVELPPPDNYSTLTLTSFAVPGFDCRSCPAVTSSVAARRSRRDRRSTALSPGRSATAPMSRSATARRSARRLYARSGSRWRVRSPHAPLRAAGLPLGRPGDHYHHRIQMQEEEGSQAVRAGCQEEEVQEVEALTGGKR